MKLKDIQEKAFELGWQDVGITDATIPEPDILAYQRWVKKGHQGPLAYMENEIRCDPDVLLPGAKSAIIFVSYYKQKQVPFKKDAGLIASYARGRDYHNVHRSRLKRFSRWFEEETGEKTRGFSDSKPILERALAAKAGLGWFGKNNLLIHRKFGTFTLLSGILTTAVLDHTDPLPIHMPRCGSCTRCIEACPTGALTPYNLDASKCLSTHLIESKEELSEEVKKQNPGYVFGCDLCQDSCPHNWRKEPITSGDFTPEQGIGTYLNEEQLSLMKPEDLFGTPLRRRGLTGLQSNLR